MPFLSRSQVRACFAKNDPKWDCHEMARETKNIKKLPEAVKTAMVHIGNPFTKIAKELFDPAKSPPVPAQVIQQEMIESTKMDKRKGMTPVEYRNDLTHRRTGIVQKNTDAKKRT